MQKHYWIIVDDGDTFEGHQGHWEDTFFSNASIKNIKLFLQEKEQLESWCYRIREMTEQELKKHPEALEFHKIYKERT